MKARPELPGCVKLGAMHIYSHLVVAHALLPHLQPASPSEYYWGAVAPDIRYAAGLRRRQTPELKQIIEIAIALD